MADEFSLSVRAAAKLRLKEIEEKERLREVYNWYGDECGCGKPLGECRVHLRARPNQRPPGTHRASSDRTDWRVWLIEAGRAFGKTLSAAKYVTWAVMTGQSKWVALVNETVKDVRDVMIEHPRSGLIAVAPPWFKPVYEPSKARVTWPNGAFATIYSAEAPEALRGPGFDLAWIDEVAKFKYNLEATIDNLLFCLRELPDPTIVNPIGTRMIATTTPKPSKAYNKFSKNPSVVRVKGAMMDNATNLDPLYVADMLERYKGTRLGRQEIDGELLEDVPGALWNPDWFEREGFRLWNGLPRGVTPRRVCTAIDPAAGAIDPNQAAEVGIVTGCVGSDGRGYILADDSCKGSPTHWGKKAVQAYHHWEGDIIVGERNHGGDMVEHVVRTVPATPSNPSGANVSFRTVWATRGKEIRAEPVSALYEQGKISHIGDFRQLEDELSMWVPGDPSPNRLDALVWCLTELMLDDVSEDGSPMASGRRRGFRMSLAD